MLLSKGAPIGRCAVREAIRRLSLDSLEILSALLEYGWNINEEMEWNAPPALSLVVKKTNDLSYIQWFLDHGADPDAACLTDTTSLSIAVQWGALPVIKLLFERTSAPYRGQLLHRAAFRTREDADEVLKLVFSRCPEDINRIMYWHQPLPYAMYREGGLGTPLHNVAQQGKVGAARILLDGGADASLKNSVGMTALRVAERAGNAEVAQVLRALEE